eukprot:scaffold59225_cov61-Cyclotella_meneghiniana.AAC.1
MEVNLRHGGGGLAIFGVEYRLWRLGHEPIKRARGRPKLRSDLFLSLYRGGNRCLSVGIWCVSGVSATIVEVSDLLVMGVAGKK